jgi:hypothetical protein
MRKITMALAAGVVLAAAGCTSTPAKPSAETIAGTVSGSQAAADLNSTSTRAPLVFPVMSFSGAVTTSARRLALTGGGKAGNAVFRTPAGDLDVHHVPGGKGSMSWLSPQPPDASPGHIRVSDLCTFSAVFRTPAGDLDVHHVPGGKGSMSWLSPQPPDASPGHIRVSDLCTFSAVFSAGTYTVTGGTGEFAKATGHGTYRVTAYGEADLLKGKSACSDTTTGPVLADGAEIAFLASGPLKR